MKAHETRRVAIAEWAAVFFSGLGALAGAGEAAGVTPDQALQKLMEGNKRYLEFKLVGEQRADAATRASLAKGQKPFAIVLSCSDSRVPPEVVFDEGLGDLFVVRVAGNVANPVNLGSIEYAVEHLGSPLIVVMGHERCGAVTAAVDAQGEPEGNIGAILRSIDPAVRKARAGYKGQDHAELVEAAVDENVKLVAASLVEQSPLIKHAVEEGKVRIVTAKYDLDDGSVTLLAGKQ